MRGKDLQPCELKIMNIVWQEHPIPAKRIVQLLTPETGWSKNTIYTLTTRIIAKGFIRRTDPGFVCEPLVTPCLTACTAARLRCCLRGCWEILH